MEKIKELKREAYKIATEKYRDGYRWAADVRVAAMEAYARLVIAENSTTQN